MPNPPNPRRPKRGTFQPKPEIKSLVVTSGNTINGLGETEVRQASPFFWHPPDLHPYGELQTVARASSRKCPGTEPVFQQAYTYPELVPVAEEKNEASPQVLSSSRSPLYRSRCCGTASRSSISPISCSALSPTEPRNSPTPVPCCPGLNGAGAWRSRSYSAGMRLALSSCR